MKMIVFITGASGVGKTTLINCLKKRIDSIGYAFFHFDSIGVPPLNEMVVSYGSASAWQKVKTQEWIDKLVLIKDKDFIIIEGQVDITFIRDAFSKHGFSRYAIVHLDCSEEAMGERLSQRGQKELFTQDMKNWLRYLREQAKEYSIATINTTTISAEEVIEKFKKIVRI